MLLTCRHFLLLNSNMNTVDSTDNSSGDVPPKTKTLKNTKIIWILKDGADRNKIKHNNTKEAQSHCHIIRQTSVEMIDSSRDRQLSIIISIKWVKSTVVKKYEYEHQNKHHSLGFLD